MRLPPLLKKKRLLVPLILLALYTLVGFVVVPLVLRAQLEARLPALLHRQATVRDVAFNPFALSLALRGVDIRERDGGPFVSFEELFVDVGALRLVTGRVAFDAIRLTNPALAATLLPSGSFSFADLLAQEPDAAPPAPEPPKAPLRIVIDLFELSEGAFTFKDQTRADSFEATLTPLTFTLRDFTTETGRSSRYVFDARFGDATFSYEGDFSASPLQSKGRLSMQGVQLAAFRPYLAERTQLALTDGVLGIRANYEIDGAVAPMRAVVEDAQLDVMGLIVEGPGEEAPVFSLGSLAVRLKRLDATQRTVALDEVMLADGVVRARREADGQLQIGRLAKPPGEGAVEAQAPAEEEAEAQSDGEPGWSVSLDRFALTNWALAWDDRSLADPVAVKVDQVEVEAKQVRWPAQGPVDTRLSLRWMEQGTVTVAGGITPEPLEGALRVTVADFSLAPLDGYLREASLDGSLRSLLLATELETTFAEGGKSYAAKGAVHLRDLALADRALAPVVTARAIDLEGLDVKGSPDLSLALETVRVTELVTRVTKDAKGELNVANLTKPAPASASAPATSGPGMKARVGAVVVDGLGVEWLDRTTAPPFATSVRRLRGRVTNLTWPLSQRVRMDLRGRLDQATLALGGSILPRGNDSVGTFTLGLSGYDLPPVSPYSLNYTAQPVIKGKMSLDLDWKLGGRKVNATNHLLVDQLDFGDRVADAHPDAMSLPLGLAVAILSDRHGLIDLQLPMTGDLDDPEFAWGGMVWKTLANLLEKVATAPFALLGGMFSGGDPDALQSVGFAAGEATAVGDEAAKVESLASMLEQRPRLRLELSPGVDPVGDQEALARRQLRQALQAAAGPGAPPLDEAEYQRRATVMWKKGRVTPETNPLPAEPSFQQIEAELLARQPVDDAALAVLSRERGAWVADALEAEGVERARIFVLPASSEVSAVGVSLK